MYIEPNYSWQGGNVIQHTMRGTTETIFETIAAMAQNYQGETQKNALYQVPMELLFDDESGGQPVDVADITAFFPLHTALFRKLTTTNKRTYMILKHLIKFVPTRDDSANYYSEILTYLTAEGTNYFPFVYHEFFWQDERLQVKLYVMRKDG